MISYESAAASKRRLHVFTVDDYCKMGEAGILGEDDRVELIEGEIIEMPPIGNAHRSVVIWLNRQLNQRLSGDQALVLVQDEVRMSHISQPLPDVVLLKPAGDSYRSHRPEAADVLLLIEVSDSSAVYDRRIKAPLYANSGIAEYWIVDVNSETVEVYRDPADDAYGATRIANRGETVSPIAFPDLELSVDEILG